MKTVQDAITTSLQLSFQSFHSPLNEAIYRRASVLDENVTGAHNLSPKCDCISNGNDKRCSGADLAGWKCEMKEEHVNETEKEINSRKRQIF